MEEMSSGIVDQNATDEGTGKGASEQKLQSGSSLSVAKKAVAKRDHLCKLSAALATLAAGSVSVPDDISAEL